MVVRTVEQLVDSMSATDFHLTAEESCRLGDVIAPQMDHHPYSASGFAATPPLHHRHRQLRGIVVLS